MQQKIDALVEKARDRHGDITPCGGKEFWHECITGHEEGELMLWYNCSLNSTHIVIEGS